MQMEGENIDVDTTNFVHAVYCIFNIEDQSSNMIYEELSQASYINKPYLLVTGMNKDLLLKTLLEKMDTDANKYRKIIHQFGMKKIVINND